MSSRPAPDLRPVTYSLQPRPAVPAGFAPIAWHHLRTAVPIDWEPTAYSVEDRAGRIEFATRRGLMATLGWEPCSIEPDRDTTMLAFLRHNVLKQSKHARDAYPQEKFHTAAVGLFQLGWAEDGGPCQAMAYSERERVVVRWVFEPSQRTQPDWPRSLRPFLENFDFNDSPDGIDYQLYGLHAALPRAFRIEDMVTLPANVMLTLESDDDQRKVTFRRWGLPDMLLQGLTLVGLHERVLRTNGSTVQSVRDGEVNGMRAAISEFEAPREHHMDRFMGRRWPHGQAVIWHDTVGRRLYAFEQVGPAKSPPLDFSSVFPGLTLTKA